MQSPKDVAGRLGWGHLVLFIAPARKPLERIDMPITQGEG